MTTHTSQTGGELAQLVGAALQRAERTGGRLWGTAARLAVARPGQAYEPEELLRRIDDQLARLGQVQAVLQELRVRVDDAARAHDSAGCFCDTWLDRRRAEVRAAFAMSPDAGRSAWLDTYASALRNDQFRTCRRLAQDAWPWARADRHLPVVFRLAAVALDDGRPVDALPALQELADDSRGAGAAGVTSRVTGMVLLARIHLRVLSDCRTARAWCERARTAAPGDGRPTAVLGECLAAEGSLGDAEREFLRAVEEAPGLADGYVGLALLEQTRANWEQARSWYDDALAAVGEHARLGALMAPAPGNLYWHLARRLRDRDPAAALEALDRALELGVVWKKPHAKRKVYSDRAAVLERLGRCSEAADSYYESGRRYCWIGDAGLGLPRLRRAVALDPGHAEAHWQLADALRLLSYRPDYPYVDAATVAESEQVWEQGMRQGRPGPDTAWAYLVRALLNEQRGKLTAQQRPCYWTSVRLLEQAILLHPTYATAWAYLGKYHRLLGNLASAADATRQALDADPADVSALEQHAAVLLELGDYAGAAEHAERRTAVAEEPFPRYVRAAAELMSGSVDEAVGLLDAVVASLPDHVELRALRALAASRARGRPAAEDDHRLLWARHGEPLPREAQPLVAWSGMQLGHVDEAVAQLEALVAGEFFGSVPVQCLLGLALVVRGHEPSEDVRRGAALLVEGVEIATAPHELRVLADLLVPAARGRLEDAPSRRDAVAVLDDATTRARARAEALVQHPRTVAEELAAVAGSTEAADVEGDAALAVAAASARLALQEGSPESASQTWARLLRSGALPEAERGLVRAVERLRDAADAASGEQRLALVRTTAVGLLGVLRSSGAAQQELQAGLDARAGFAALLLGDSEAARGHLLDAVRTIPPAAAVPLAAGAGQRLLTTAEDYWRTYEALQALATTAGTSRTEAAFLRECASELSLSRLLRLAAGDVEPTAVFPIVPVLACRLGPELAPAPGSALERRLDGRIATLRQRLEEDLGVRLPGVLLRADPELGARDYVVEVHGAAAAAGALPEGEGPAPLDALVEALDAQVRRRLATFVRVDDLESLPAAAGTPMLGQLDQSSTVRLHRVVQALLADGVPLSRTVLEVASGRAEVDDVPDVLRAARLRIAGRLPGNLPSDVRAALPEDLVDRAAAGLLAGTPPRWQLERRAAVRLVADVVGWWRAGPGDGATAMVVPDGLRPFLRRLLAGDLPDVAVLSKEEVDERSADPALVRTAAVPAPAPARPGGPPQRDDPHPRRAGAGGVAPGVG